jgi:hypothetical protein
MRALQEMAFAGEEVDSRHSVTGHSEPIKSHNLGCAEENRSQAGCNSHTT